MKRLLFVSNGHGEAAIADRISFEVASLAPGVRSDHLALVGEAAAEAMNEVGPRRAMPSGGLIAMGNARNLLRDLRGGLLALTWTQAQFLRRARGRYDAVVAVGDAYALAMALLARTRTLFVGSAKSVAVAPYGAFEARILARALARFVRDEATAKDLRRHGVEAEVANAIVDLFGTSRNERIEPAVADFSCVLALFPGSRDTAYEDADFLCRVVAELAVQRPGLGGVLSVAPGLDAERFAAVLRRTGWQVNAGTDELVPFVLRRDDRELVRAWRGTLGPLLTRATLVLGQAGTANEAAAAAAVPVIAFERDRDRKARWYRRRQQGLLGEGLAVLPGSVNEAVAGVTTLLNDAGRRERMSAAGRSRMGAPGGARRIADRILSVLGAA
jgi:uncharacterized protein (TIGR03492 family)